MGNFLHVRPIFSEIIVIYMLLRVCVTVMKPELYNTGRNYILPKKESPGEIT
jgi:hypothetical protein